MRRRLSRFEAADQGTLFLDEIANASLAVQEKILRVIEYGRFERVGGNEEVIVDVRLIAATNVDLPSLADSGGFRSDLLDRLAFDVVTIPPLRERAEDIPLLAEHFGRAMARELERDGFRGFSAAALAQLAAHSWPGNVRELKNVAERSVHRWAHPDAKVDEIILDAFASPHRPPGPIAAPPLSADASPRARDAGGDVSFLARVRAFEEKLLADALAASHFNQRRAAAALGLSYHQLRHYLRKYRLASRA